MMYPIRFSALLFAFATVLSSCGGGGGGNSGSGSAGPDPLTYPVTPASGAGGSLSPATVQTVTEGEQTSFTVTADDGFVIDEVTGCGGSLSGNQFTTGSVDADCTVSATFSVFVVQLNDTGVDWCADNDTRYHHDGTLAQKIEGCGNVEGTHPGQDGMTGRDAEARAGTLAKTGAGDAGFDFTRVCNSGERAGQGDCPAEPTLGLGVNDWACTRDNGTGLVWEVKVHDDTHGHDDTHLRHVDHTYSWYDPDSATNGGNAGTENGGVCVGDCDTHAYVQAVNAAGLCGGSDWRLPSDVVLQSIVHYGRAYPVIDSNYFPNTPDARFWSASAFAGNTDISARAWRVWFSVGNVDDIASSFQGRVRLVRGGN